MDFKLVLSFILLLLYICNILIQVIQIVVNCNIASSVDAFPAKRYAKILEELMKDPASQGGPPDIIVCPLAEVICKFVST